MSLTNKDRVPFFCPVCHSPQSTSLAADSYRRVQACDLCETYIYYLNKEKWNEGWRPSVREARRYLWQRNVSIYIPQEDKTDDGSGNSESAWPAD